MSKRYDLAIVGAGSVGLIAAEFAAQLGARVVLLERDRIGGDCTWTGCVPSKALIRIAKVAHDMRSAAGFGIAATTPIVDMPRVRAYLDAAIARIYAGTTPEALAVKGIDVLFGAARFADRRTLVSDGARVRARNIIIATGARPDIPDIPGIENVPYWTYRDVFSNEALPASMIVLGGGPIGVEIAQAYARLGTRVTIFAQTFLPKEDPQAAAIVRRVFEREGITIVPERIRGLQRSGGRISARSDGHECEAEKLFVASGRVAMLEGLQLEAAGVAYTSHGVTVNARLETTARNIYAAGDVLGREQFSHYAGWQGFQAARNALLPRNADGLSRILPRVTFCDPEVATVGLTEAEARKAHGDDVVVGRRSNDRLDRAVTDNDLDGTTTIVTRRNGVILGATIVGARAGEAIAEITLAMQAKLNVSLLAGTIHAYPTYASGVQLVASELAVQRLLSGPRGILVRLASMFSR